MSLLRPGLDSSLMELVEEAGRNVQRSGLLMRELLADFPEHAPLARDLKVCEQEGDRITHDIIHRLTAGRRVRAPFAASDGYALATALDDIVDYTEHAAAQMVLYGVEAPMEQAVEFAGCWSAPASRLPERCAACAPVPSWAPTWWRSIASRTRATASSATPSPPFSRAASTRWW